MSCRHQGPAESLTLNNKIVFQPMGVMDLIYTDVTDENKQ